MTVHVRATAVARTSRWHAAGSLRRTLCASAFAVACVVATLSSGRPQLLVLAQVSSPNPMHACAEFALILLPSFTVAVLSSSFRSSRVSGLGCRRVRRTCPCSAIRPCLFTTPETQLPTLWASCHIMPTVCDVCLAPSLVLLSSNMLPVAAAMRRRRARCRQNLSFCISSWFVISFAPNAITILSTTLIELSR